MWEPKLLARLDSIKHHLMTGMAPHYVVDEIECLQRDINEEMRATSRRSDYAPYKPKFQLSGEFVDIKDIRLTDVPLDPIHKSPGNWVCQIHISPDATQGAKGPNGVHGYTPPKSNCHEYADGPLQHFLIKPGTQGEKKPKDALGLGPY